MKLQQFNPQMISITDLRRDIRVLDAILKEYGKAYVMRNQEILFVATTPQEPDSVDRAVSAISQIRQNHKKQKILASDYVIKMRDKRASKWKR